MSTLFKVVCGLQISTTVSNKYALCSLHCLTTSGALLINRWASSSFSHGTYIISFGSVYSMADTRNPTHAIVFAYEAFAINLSQGFNLCASWYEECNWNCILYCWPGAVYYACIRLGTQAKIYRGCWIGECFHWFWEYYYAVEAFITWKDSFGWDVWTQKNPINEPMFEFIRSFSKPTQRRSQSDHGDIR